MPNHRGLIPAPSAREDFIQLRARLYSHEFIAPVIRPVLTQLPAKPRRSLPSHIRRVHPDSARQTARYPWVEHLFGERILQPFIHDTHITVIEGTARHHFMLFFQNHVRLPTNHTLNHIWRGDIVVMRIGQDGNVINLRSGDARRVDWLVSCFCTRAHKHRQFRFRERITFAR